MTLAKAWTAIDRLSVIRKSDLTDKIKQFFPSSNCVDTVIWMHHMHGEKLDSNYTWMLWAILNKSRMQNPKKQQLYSHLPPIIKTFQTRQTRHVGHCWRSKDELISDVFLWTPNMDEQRLDDQIEPIYNSFVPIQDVAWKTSQERWTIETDGERGSGRSKLVAQQDDDVYT